MVNTSGGTPVYSASFAAPYFSTGGVAPSSFQQIPGRDIGSYELNILKSGGISVTKKEPSVSIAPVRNISSQFQSIQTIPTQGISSKGVGFVPFPSNYYTSPTTRIAGDKGQVIQTVTFQPSKTEQQIIQQTLAEQNTARIANLAQSQKVNQIRGENFGQVSFGFGPVYNVEQRIPSTLTTMEGKQIPQQAKILKDFVRSEDSQLYEGQNIKTSQVYQQLGIKPVTGQSFTFGATFDKQGNIDYNDINLSPRKKENLPQLQERLGFATTPTRTQQGLIEKPEEFYSGGFAKTPTLGSFRFPISIGEVKVTTKNIGTAGPKFIEGFGVAGKIYQDTKNWFGNIFSKENIGSLSPIPFGISTRQNEYSEKIRSGLSAPILNFKTYLDNEQNAKPKLDEVNNLVTQYNEKLASIEKEQDQEKQQQRIDKELKPLEEKINKTQQEFESSYKEPKPTVLDKVLTATLESGAKAFGMSSSPYTTEQIWKKTFTDIAKDPLYYGSTAVTDAGLIYATRYLSLPFEAGFNAFKFYGVQKAAREAAEKLRPPPIIERTPPRTTTTFKGDQITPKEITIINPSGSKTITKITQSPKDALPDDIVAITKQSTRITERPVTIKQIQKGLYELESTVPDANKITYLEYIGKSGKFGLFGKPQFQNISIGPRSSFPKTAENIVRGPLSKEDQLRYGLTAIGKNEYKFLEPDPKIIEQLEKTKAISFERTTEKFTPQQIKGSEPDFGDYFFSKRLERPIQPAESFNLFRTRGSFEPQRQQRLGNIFDPTYLGVKRFVTTTREKLTKGFGTKKSKSQIKQYQDPFAAYTETYFGKTFGKTRPPINYARIQKSLDELRAGKTNKGKSQVTETIKETPEDYIIKPVFAEEQKTSFAKVISPIIATSRGYDFLGTIQQRDELRKRRSDYIEQIYAFPEPTVPKEIRQPRPVFQKREELFTLPKFPTVDTGRFGIVTGLGQNIRPEQILSTKDLIGTGQRLTPDTAIIQKQIQNPFQDEILRQKQPQRLRQNQILETPQKFLQLQQFEQIRPPKFTYDFKAPAVGKIFPFGGISGAVRSFGRGGRVFKVFDVAKVPAGKVKVGVGYYEVSPTPIYEIKKRRKTKDEFFDIY